MLYNLPTKKYKSIWIAEKLLEKSIRRKVREVTTIENCLQSIFQLEKLSIGISKLFALSSVHINFSSFRSSIKAAMLITKKQSNK